MTFERISAMAYRTVLDMAGRNYSTDKGPWLWMVEELGWQPEAAYLALIDASDPFQRAVPCWHPRHTQAWERAASELQMDYTSVEFGDVTYWIRS